MPYRSERRIWRELVIAVLGSLIAALLWAMCTGPASIHLDLRIGTAAATSKER